MSRIATEKNGSSHPSEKFMKICWQLFELSCWHTDRQKNKEIQKYNLIGRDNETERKLNNMRNDTETADKQSKKGEKLVD